MHTVSRDDEGAPQSLLWLWAVTCDSTMRSPERARSGQTVKCVARQAHVLHFWNRETARLSMDDGVG